MDWTGIGCALASALFMGTIGVFSKITGLPAETVTFFRLFFGAGFMFLFLLLLGQTRALRLRPSRAVICNGALLAGFILFYIQAMHYTTMATAIMCVYLAPVLAAVVAHCFLREKLTTPGWALIGTALLGFCLIMECNLELASDIRHVRGIFFAALAMLCYAGFILVNRMHNPLEPVVTRAFYQMLIGALLMLPFFLANPTPISPVNGAWLLATGLVPGFLALYCAVVALSRLPAATFGTLAYCEPVSVVLLGWLLFGETLSSLQMAGCILIIAGGVGKTILAAAPSPQAHAARS